MSEFVEEVHLSLVFLVLLVLHVFICVKLSFFFLYYFVRNWFYFVREALHFLLDSKCYGFEHKLVWFCWFCWFC